MALKVLMLRKKIDEKRKALESLNEKAADFEKREAELAEAIEEAETEEEKAAVEEAVEEFEAEKEENEKEKAELAAKEEAKNKNTEAAAELTPAEGELTAENEKAEGGHFNFSALKSTVLKNYFAQKKTGFEGYEKAVEILEKMDA